MQLPFVVRQASANLDYLGLAAPASFGLATPVLHARYGLLDEGESGLADVAVELGVGLPLGSADALGRDAFRVVPKVAAGRSFGLFRVGLEAGALLRPTVSLSPGSPDARDQVGSAVRLGASVTTTNQGVRGELDVRASLPLVKSPGAVEVLGGARYQVSRAWELFALAGVGLGTEPGTPQFRVLAGITFGGDTKRPVPLPMPVAALACPNDADALRTASGAELRDSDGDGQPDASDAAPCTDEHKRVAEDFERQLQLLSEKIYFAFGSDKVSKPSTYVLDEIAELLNRHPEVELVHVAGHTDIIGPHRYNQGLSERRAKAVVKYLTEERAVSAKRLDVEGHSFKLPDASNATIEGRSRNRRVELTVILRGSQKPAATQLSRR
jgi:outer membrane protein OmpA-like peptidoglycan-associated protein